MRPEPVEGAFDKAQDAAARWYEASIRGLLTLGSTAAHRALIADQPALRGD
jgi:hypothetical protein